MWRLAPALVAAVMVSACTGKAGRVTMRLEPRWESAVLVSGSAPTVRVTNAGPGSVALDVRGAIEERIDLGDDEVYTSKLDGSTRLIFQNTSDEEAIVELRAVHYRRLVIERSPSQADGQEGSR